MFQLMKLDYQYDALEPYFDEKTMLIHHTKHHQSYVNNLNNALSKYPELQAKNLEELLVSLSSVPEEIRTTVRNNAGGIFNHNFFFKLLTKRKTEPSEQLRTIIENEFDNIENLKATFYSAALSNFGSGWTWICLDKTNKLKIVNTSGHDCIISTGYKPLVVIDIWEHAYYLKFQNRRNEYIEIFWELIDWEFVSTLYDKYLNG